jgi:hypothetical protein
MSKRPQATTPAAFSRFLDVYPSHLSLWRAGEDSLYEILGRLNIHPVVEQRALAQRQGPHVASMMLSRAHHNQLGICVAWALRYLPGQAQEVEVRTEDLIAAFELAGRYWSLKNVMAEVRQGVRTFEPQGRRLTLAYRGNALLDATDRLLDLFDDITSMPEGPPADMAMLRSWLSSEGKGRPWEQVPLIMREELRYFARSMLARQDAYLPVSLDVGGFTMGDATSVLTELFARAWHSAGSIMQGSSDPDVVLPARPRDTLIGQLASATKVPRDRVATIIDLVTADLAVCGDPCLTPVIRLPNGDLVALSSLITPGALMRNFTRRIQLDNTRFGEAGRQLGLLGSNTVGATLRRRLNAEVKVAERVKVFDAGHRQAGDFDVVAFDPSTSRIVVFEVVWNIGPDGSAEVAESERRAHEKREQVGRLRADVAGGALPKWPAGWDVPDDATYRWFILTPDVLPALPLEEDGIVVRSHQMLERFQWTGDRLGDMVRSLLDPPPPPKGLMTTDWITVPYGPFRVRVEWLRA